MKEFIRILKIFFGYLLQPKYYPELLRKIKKNVFERSSSFKGQKESEVWCEKHAKNLSGVLLELTSKNFKEEDKLSVKYEELYNSAKEAEKNCPIKMGGAGALDLIYQLSDHVNAKNILETGVAYGWSSFASLLSLKKRKGTLYSSDLPYLDKNGDKYVGCVVPEVLKPNWELYRYADKESFPKIFESQNSFELIHYDSDKSYNGRMWAYPILWEKLTNGGFLISDDIEDNSAFMDYCDQNKLEPIVLFFEEKYIGILRK